MKFRWNWEYFWFLRSWSILFFLSKQVNLVDVTAEYLIDFVHFRQSCCSDEEDDDDDDDDDDDVDTASLNASASSSMLPNFQAYLMKQGEEVDEMWHRHVQKVLTETSVSNAINTSQIFPKLYRVCIAWCRQCSQCINCTKTQLEVSLTVFPLTANYKTCYKLLSAKIGVRGGERLEEMCLLLVVLWNYEM